MADEDFAGWPEVAGRYIDTLAKGRRTSTLRGSDPCGSHPGDTAEPTLPTRWRKPYAPPCGSVLR